MGNEIATNPVPPAVAKAAGLRYVTDARPEIGPVLSLSHPNGQPLSDRASLGRIRSLAIPPVWTEAWICSSEDGHIQAVGRDARARKQYRYHPKWREVRDESKYSRMLGFGEKMPAIRRRVIRDLSQRGMSRKKVLAAVVRLLETTLIRVGNDEYAQTNQSYGLTTLRNRHAKVSGGLITFEFVGKSGKAHSIDRQDRQLVQVVKNCQELPGQELFGYVDDDGTVRDVTSDDVNTYLREIAGDEFTAKDFRTWAGTVLAAVALREFEAFNSSSEAKANITEAIVAVARMLGNTPAICRKCYVHPGILESHLEGDTISTLQQESERSLSSSLKKLRPEEAAVMLLRERLTAAHRAGGRRSARSLTRK